MAKSKGIQLDLPRRKKISQLISKSKSAQFISVLLDVHPTTISREVYKHRKLLEDTTEDETLCFRYTNQTTCRLKHRCGKKTCMAQCRECRQLQNSDQCASFEQSICNKQTRFPFVCNGCPKITICHKTKHYYDPNVADEQYKETLSKSREVLNLSSDEYVQLNENLEQGIEKGQSIHHNVKANLDTIRVTDKTIYNYINTNKVSVIPLDLPRLVRLKKRKNKLPSQYEYNENIGIDRAGRRYSDWLVFQVKNKIVNYWETDFLGAPKDSDQMVLVLTIPSFSFTLLFPLYNPNANSVKEVFNMLYSQLGELLLHKFLKRFLPIEIQGLIILRS